MGENGLRSVMKNKIRYIELAVINDCLVKCFLRERNRFRLELDENQWRQILRIDDGVGAFVLQGDFDSNEVHRIAEMVYEAVQKILPNPLFGSEPDIFSAPVTKDLSVLRPNHYALYVTFASYL